MHYNTAMITFVVGANALKLHSRLETEDFWSDALDFVIDAGETIGKGFVDAGEYIGSADGLQEDLETFGKTVTSADFWEKDVKNVAENVTDYVFSGDLFEEGYNWMADGSNWEAFGKVMLGTGISLINGDFDKAGNIITNWDLYEGKNWDPETKY